MTDAAPTKTWGSAIVWATIHGISWVGFLAVMLWVVPGFADALADFGTDLPAVTGLAIVGSGVCRQYWYVFVLMGPMLLTADVFLLYFLGARRETRVIRTIWSVLMLLLPILLAGITLAAVVVPLISLIKSLR